MTDMRSFLGPGHFVPKDFERDEFFQVFSVADELRHYAEKRRNGDLLTSKTLLTAFYQPSTRTRLATEAAMHRLGRARARVLRRQDDARRRFYQESIKDTVHMLEYYGDVIAMRHFQQGAPAEAAKWASVPVINCGDGGENTPPRCSRNLYTTWKHFGTLDGLRVLCVGDMRMRTMHSILYAMSHVRHGRPRGVPARDVVAPRVQGRARRAQRMYREVESVEEVHRRGRCHLSMEPVVQADYTKSRDEAHDDKGQTPAAYKVTRQLLRDKAKRTSIICTAARMDEAPPDVDGHPPPPATGSEAFNGVAMRMALLSLVLGAVELGRPMQTNCGEKT